jgi:hypothetical protein
MASDISVPARGSVLIVGVGASLGVGAASADACLGPVIPSLSLDGKRKNARRSGVRTGWGRSTNDRLIHSQLTGSQGE